ncbi:hypothetical protein Krac_1980 [Ktedonobacter racemifer DSM 44963]|uniref:Uncharacterized protein n=1 Tax=Ktedonobacter racemifer DSM 44963 TaxID=485913 RepID=D6U434_KTERA|nr:hypothetical protein Krac_1980 [Ktedonobacter racemifer DSM 44963]
MVRRLVYALWQFRCNERILALRYIHLGFPVS